MILVTAAIIEKEGKILLAQRKEGQHLAGLWEFPGGKIEAGESPEACLKRELQEELGLETVIGQQIADTIHHYPNKTVRLLSFRVRIQSGKPCLHAHQQFAWVMPALVPSYPLAPADIPIIDKYLAMNNVKK